MTTPGATRFGGSHDTPRPVAWVVRRYRLLVPSVFPGLSSVRSKTDTFWVNHPNLQLQRPLHPKPLTLTPPPLNAGGGARATFSTRRRSRSHPRPTIRPACPSLPLWTCHQTQPYTGRHDTPPAVPPPPPFFPAPHAFVPRRTEAPLLDLGFRVHATARWFRV